MNSKVNFHGQEIDLEKFIESHCIKLVPLDQSVFTVTVKTAYGTAEYSFYTAGGCQSWEMAKELDSLQEDYAARKYMCEAILQQQKVADDLLKEFKAKSEEYHAATTELAAMKRKYSNDYR